MRFRRSAFAALIAACLVGATTAPAVAAEQPRAASKTTASVAFAQTMANPADVEFVEMMIPHHFQALVMSRMAPTRASNQLVRNLAERINVGQELEIDVMQGWQGSNGLPITDAEEAYQHHMMHMPPEELAEMGMATQEQLDALEASSGTAFDVMYLELMIPHHQGAIDMVVDLLTYGNDMYLQQLAMDMLAEQYMQILQMEELLDDLR